MEAGSVMNDSRPIRSIESAFVGESCDQVVLYVAPKEGIAVNAKDCDVITAYYERDGSIWFAVHYQDGSIDRVNSRDVAVVSYA